MPTSSIPLQQASSIHAVEKAVASSIRDGTLPSKIAKRQIYRVRDSLPGAFAIEELDMTNDVGTGSVKSKVMNRERGKGKTFRKSEVSVFDLTGD
jgi:hypothetical protein